MPIKPTKLTVMYRSITTNSATNHPISTHADFVLVLTQVYHKWYSKCSWKGRFASCCPTRKLVQQVEICSDSFDVDSNPDQPKLQLKIVCNNPIRKLKLWNSFKKETFRCSSSSFYGWSKWDVSKKTVIWCLHRLGLRACRPRKTPFFRLNI